jgi:outer membrane protein TolC
MALEASSSRPIDVEFAAERVRGAMAALGQANAAWLPTITIGGDYNRHDGQVQDVAGNIITTSKSSMMFGAGSGFGAAALFSPNDVYFGMTTARQILRARRADAQAAENDSMLAVTDAYFNVEQARGDLAASADAARRTQELVERIKKLATGLVPALEVVRVEAEFQRRQEAEASAQERWQLAGTELARLLRLDSAAQVEPVEPPHLQITLIEPDRLVDDLISLGLMKRPELASRQAQVQATLNILRQEKLRPFIPSVLLRGASTPVTGTLGGGIFAGGLNGNIANAGGRDDFDLQILWQLDNLGFGNYERARLRESEHRAAIIDLFRIQDRIAAEVARAHTQVRQANRRVHIAEQQVKLALDSYDANLIGLGQIRRAGELVQTIVRPQEAIAAVQNLAQAYSSYYLAIADSNRAQFRLYRAIGQPAESLATHPAAEPVPAPPSTQLENRTLRSTPSNGPPSNSPNAEADESAPVSASFQPIGSRFR